jgi:hypothetical protein
MFDSKKPDACRAFSNLFGLDLFLVSEAHCQTGESDGRVQVVI